MPLIFLAFRVFVVWILQDRTGRRELWRNIKAAAREDSKENSAVADNLCVAVRNYNCEPLPAPPRERTEMQGRIGGHRLSDGQWTCWWKSAGAPTIWASLR